MAANAINPAPFEIRALLYPQNALGETIVITPDDQFHHLITKLHEAFGRQRDLWDIVDIHMSSYSCSDSCKFASQDWPHQMAGLRYFAQTGGRLYVHFDRRLATVPAAQPGDMAGTHLPWFHAGNYGLSRCCCAPDGHVPAVNPPEEGQNPARAVGLPEESQNPAPAQDVQRQTTSNSPIRLPSTVEPDEVDSTSTAASASPELSPKKAGKRPMPMSSGDADGELGNREGSSPKRARNGLELPSPDPSQPPATADSAATPAEDPAQHAASAGDVVPPAEDPRPQAPMYTNRDRITVVCRLLPLTENLKTQWSTTVKKNLSPFFTTTAVEAKLHGMVTDEIKNKGLSPLQSWSLKMMRNHVQIKIVFRNPDGGEGRELYTEDQPSDEELRLHHYAPLDSNGKPSFVRELHADVSIWLVDRRGRRVEDWESKDTRILTDA